MSAPLAHLHALAQRTLDAHERRAGELRARLAPVLAAGVAGAALLSPQALAGVRSGGSLSAVVFLVTVVAAFTTTVRIGRFMGAKLEAVPLEPGGVERFLAVHRALDDERRFHEAMITFASRACARAEWEVDVLHHQFTAILCGILFVLCGLALTAVVAW